MNTSDNKEKTFTIRVTGKQHEEIANLAAENNRSVSSEVLEAIKDACVCNVAKQSARLFKAVSR